MRKDLGLLLFPDSSGFLEAAIGKLGLRAPRSQDNNVAEIPPSPPMFTHIKSFTLRTAAAVACLGPVQALAQLTNEGLDDITGSSIGSGDLKEAITTIIQYVLGFVGLIAVVVIVIAGVRFIISSGEEGEKEKAKKMIIYALIGLVIILLAEAIVNFVLVVGTN